jgi:hypothetical protein
MFYPSNITYEYKLSHKMVLGRNAWFKIHLSRQFFNLSRQSTKSDAGTTYAHREQDPWLSRYGISVFLNDR